MKYSLVLGGDSLCTLVSVFLILLSYLFIGLGSYVAWLDSPIAS